jgi:hypothetical protein
MINNVTLLPGFFKIHARTKQKKRQICYSTANTFIYRVTTTTKRKAKETKFRNTWLTPWNNNKSSVIDKIEIE